MSYKNEDIMSYLMYTKASYIVHSYIFIAEDTKKSLVCKKVELMGFECEIYCTIIFNNEIDLKAVTELLMLPSFCLIIH